jgi:hypothetical protein
VQRAPGVLDTVFGGLGVASLFAMVRLPVVRHAAGSHPILPNSVSLRVPGAPQRRQGSSVRESLDKIAPPSVNPPDYFAR